MLDHRLAMRPSSNAHANPHREAFVEWARGAEPNVVRVQHPIDELLAEHHLVRSVLLAMQNEAGRLANRQPFRPELWGKVVDFVGNFGLLVHYRKKAAHLYPQLASAGLGDEIQGLDREQGLEIDQTLDLVDALQEGDWEKVLRLVVVYVGTKRQQLEREELQILLPARTHLDPQALAALRASFDEVEKKALPDKGRKEYLEIARALIREAGLGDPLAS